MRFKTSIVIALVCALCSGQALAQDDAGMDIPDDWKRSLVQSSMRAFALATTSPIESQASSTSVASAVAQSEPRATRIRRATATPRTGSTSSR